MSDPLSGRGAGQTRHASIGGRTVRGPGRRRVARIGRVAAVKHWQWIAWGAIAAPLLAALVRLAEPVVQANPPEALQHLTGRAAFWLLVATLTIRPLQRAGLRGVMTARRTLGLGAFFWATIHLLLVLVFDYAPDFSTLGSDLVSQIHLSLGLGAWLLMLPLALTSNQRAMRRLGRRWGRLHKLVWPVLLLAWAHLYAKERVATTLLWSASLAVLLLIASRLDSKRRSRAPL
ncbi:MAG: sulfoxide reductase heme-binding subunit YedZ [Candidatus Dadabacteria bacterium]|nr:MAG: sulfoxide reductase heme-binding subunit YedZ [Candidatus Dadabacteria bacterium]